MGGDTLPGSLFLAVEQAVLRLPVFFQFVVLATPDVIGDLPPPSHRIQYEASDQVILMTDFPLSAIRRKNKASLVRGIHLLRDGQLQAFVSVGNTGALVACATLTLPTLPGVDRPALLATLPTHRGCVAVLDVGGLVNASPEQILAFAILGAAHQRRMLGIHRPRVGLLNIGEEPAKGTSEHRAAYALLQQAHADFEFIGNVEGREVFHGVVDVLVTDGFTGNVFLKTAEGVSAFILESLQASLAEYPAFQALQKQVDYAQYPGAVLCGVEGIVVKCHGCSSPEALLQGILGAANLVDPRAEAYVRSGDKFKGG